jgi:uncharacterized protein YjbJ (UPF0337 family)
VETRPSLSPAGFAEAAGREPPRRIGTDIREGVTVDADRVEGKVKETEGEAQQKWGEAKDKARDTWEDVKDKAEDVVDRGEDRVDELDESDKDASKPA